MNTEKRKDAVSSMWTHDFGRTRFELNDRAQFGAAGEPRTSVRADLPCATQLRIAQGHINRLALSSFLRPSASSADFLGFFIALAAIGLLIPNAGCVRRTMTITTTPPNALVFLNDQEIGRSEVTTDFLWYGDYDVVVRQEGYETLQTNWRIKAPWYQIPPFDFFAEVLWPGEIHDAHHRHYELLPKQTPPAEEVIKRAIETREEAFGPG